MKTDISQLKVGDRVERICDGRHFMDLKVTEVTDEWIRCGAWDFDPATGAEIDDELEWGPKYGWTGTFIRVPE